MGSGLLIFFVILLAVAAAVAVYRSGRISVGFGSGGAVRGGRSHQRAK